MKPPAPYENAVTFQFGDSPELADELLALVLSGAKTATCGAMRDFNDKEPAPTVGRRRGAGRPGPPSLRDRDGQCGDPALRPGGRSLRGGGGEGPYEAWRDGHIAYFERNGGYRPDMLLACERFRVVEVFER